MFEVNRVLEDIASYEQLGPNRWRASITGVVTASAEATNPHHCLSQLARAVDSVFGRVLQGDGPFTYEGERTTARLDPLLEHMLTAGVVETTERSVE